MVIVVGDDIDMSVEETNMHIIPATAISTTEKVTKREKDPFSLRKNY